MKWVERNIGCEVYADENGRIVGEITRPIGGADWTAYYFGRPLGAYIDRESAKAAVEKVGAPPSGHRHEWEFNTGWSQILWTMRCKTCGERAEW